ncbi:response regulator [Sediminicola luteus]|uniref:DNA-binding response regulator n=1 Tax=Sediminicola luteus TaxID=319238 RepID=A0A2A4G909_9FLAO|nr:response regulator transcription factor [Sediminicola luteus]PCE64460.1 DNA-binding response regulator [Sediminicola luteus]
MIRLVIAEDHQALIDGIVSYLEHERDIEVVGHVNDGKALVAMVDELRPDVVLSDIRMPIMDGIDATHKIKGISKRIKVVAFTMFDESEAVGGMFEAGATGYVLKNSPMETVKEAIRTVAKGGEYFDKEIAVPDVVEKGKESVLSTREKQILELIGQGFSSQGISAELSIGKSTVDTHRKNMARKLGFSGKGELLRYAMDRKYKFQ